jgi:thiopeptide-type bacteriocin biosynthesis protein
MALAERIFEVDSTMTLEVIESALAAESADPDWRWQVALWQADRLLRAFSLSLDERYRFVTTAYAISVTAATGVSPSETPSMMSSQLGAQFRRLRPVIDRLLADGPAPIAIAGVPEILQRRSQQIDALACEARQLDENGRLDVPMSDWLGSILHMSMNRLIPTNARQHEVVIMALLRRLYESLMARRRSAPATDTHH